MGEVYRARDTRLDRIVAIKVLNSALVASTDLKARFEREAKAISQLNHPNICTLHDVGYDGGTDYLVMEFIEGESLAERVKRGPLPLTELVKIGCEIADALDRAHRAGIVHRDLKPGNVMLTKAGAKLLDFGLAKPAAMGAATGSGSAPLLSAAMTMTSPGPQHSPLTQQGALIGTVQYMSPEQIQGMEADARSDVFAFGTVLYEMATGKRAFEGKSQIKVASAILEDDPTPITSLQTSVPRALETVIRTCLAKNPEERYASAHDIKLQLREIGQAPLEKRPTASRMDRPLRWMVAAGLALASLAAAAILAWHPWRTTVASPVRVVGELGIEGSLATNYGASAVVSPDGRRMAFVVEDANRARRLWTRSLDQLEAKLLTGTEGARDPFFSPDGQWIGFFANNQLKKVSVEYGAVVTLAPVQDDRGGAWGEDGTIIFTPETRTGLRRIPAGGGSVTNFSTLQGNEVTNRWPQFLPGGRAVIYTSSSDGNNYENADIVAQVVATGERKTIYHAGYSPHYVAGGYLVFIHQGTLLGTRFDPERLEVTGQPVPLIPGVVSIFGCACAQLSFSGSGTAVYLGGTNEASDLYQLEWLSADNKTTPLTKQPRNYWGLSLSPDGSLLAIGAEERGSQDIFVHDWKRDVTSRLTFGSPTNVFPAWTPDGKRISFVVDEAGGRFSISWKRADGAGDRQILLETSDRPGMMSWQPDGKVLVFAQVNARQAESDLKWAPLEGGDRTGWKLGKVETFAGGPGMQSQPAFSPDGKWVAYQSNESGTWEVYVRPFPGGGSGWQVSQGGGLYPRWLKTSSVLFFANMDNQLMSVPYTASGDSFRAGTPRLWSSVALAERGAMNLNYDISPDGKRAAVVRDYTPSGKREPPRLTYVFNFAQEVAQRLQEINSK